MPKSKSYKALGRDMPKEFSKETVNTIARIEKHPTVLGIMYIKDRSVQMCTIPEAIAQSLYKKLPTLNASIRRALTEIDIEDELLAYRIVTKTNEILVAAGEEYTACVVHKIKSKNIKNSIYKN